MKKVPDHILTEIIGKKVDDPQLMKKLVENEWRIRKTLIDGERQIGTRDYREDRINVHVVMGLIVKAYIG